MHLEKEELQEIFQAEKKTCWFFCNFEFALLSLHWCSMFSDVKWVIMLKLDKKENKMEVHTIEFNIGVAFVSLVGQSVWLDIFHFISPLSFAFVMS